MDLDLVRERFDSSTDFTIGLEEEFAILDPATLELEHRFEDVYAACQRDEMLADSAAGELIASEIEIRSGRAESFAEAVAKQRERRRRLFELIEEMGLALGAMGTHPWADYLDQRIIDTPHYNRLQHELGWVAQRNNTWSMHVHMGVRGADRAIAVCDWMRELLPLLLAVSANSPFLDRRDTGLHTVRTEIFTRTFPRCGVPAAVRRLGSLRRLRRHAGADRHGRRVDPALVERAPAPSLRHGRGADLRRPDPGRRVLRPRRPDRRLHRPDRARLRRARLRRRRGAAGRPRDRGEPLAGDPPRDERQDDRFQARRRWSRPARCSTRCSPGPSRHARSSASRSSCRTETAPSGLARRSTPGLAIEDVYRDAVRETKRTYTAACAARVRYKLPRRSTSRRNLT